MAEGNEKRAGYLTGQFLIAMPHMPDERFARAVIFVCEHGPEGAMGLVVNKAIPSVTFPELLGQLGVSASAPVDGVRVHFGGPVETGRGFVLHSPEFERDGTVTVNDDVRLTATIDILRAIADGQGPREMIMALGYAGWGPGQLDTEIQANGWLNVAAASEILFDEDLDAKWERAIESLGVSPAMLSTEAGRA